MTETMLPKFVVKIRFKTWVPVNALAEVMVGDPAVRGEVWDRQERLLMADLIYQKFREVFREHVTEYHWNLVRRTARPTGRRQGGNH